MAKGVGKAFEKALTTKEEKEDIGSRDGKFELMNKNRQEIFQYLCLHPCSCTSMISKFLGLSIHTTKWHLRRLVENGFISKMSLGKKKVFYPTDMVAERDIPILEILNTDKAKAIYVIILHRKGLSQAEISEELGLKNQEVIWYTKKLESLGLIKSLEDGKYRRYYPTDLLSRKNDENGTRLKNFRNNIMKRLRREMLSPTVLRSTEDKLVLRIARGGNKAVLTLHINPFVTILS
jgi:predicted transcriptional regulator